MVAKPTFPSVSLRQNPRDPALSLNCFGVGVVPGVDGTTPVSRGRTTFVLDSATHRARDRDIHAAVTGSVMGRRVADDRPCDRARCDNTNDNADHHHHDTAFARRERVGRWGLATVGRRRLLRPANSIDPQYSIDPQ
jgi:hypothetical protein